MNKLILGLALVLAASLHPSAVHAQSGTTSTDAEQTFFEFQVDQAAKLKSGPLPVYPERLRDAKVEGQVLVQFIVDEHGLAQMNTFKVLKSPDNELSESVRRAVSGSSYAPAEVRGRKVKQLVQQPFRFTYR